MRLLPDIGVLAFMAGDAEMRTLGNDVLIITGSKCVLWVITLARLEVCCDVSLEYAASTFMVVELGSDRG
jgi:hypothetical protein